MTVVTHDQLVEKIREIVAKACKMSVAHVPADAGLVDLGIDSVSVVDISMEIEDVFAVELNEHDPAFASVKTVRDLADFVQRVST